MYPKLNAPTPAILSFLVYIWNPIYLAGPEYSLNNLFSQIYIFHLCSTTKISSQTRMFKCYISGQRWIFINPNVPKTKTLYPSSIIIFGIHLKPNNIQVMLYIQPDIKSNYLAGSAYFIYPPPANIWPNMNFHWAQCPQIASPYPSNIIIFGIHLEPNNMQVSYVSSWTCIFTTSRLNIIIWPEVHFPGISNCLKNIWPDLHFHAPIYVAEAMESIPLGHF